MKRYAKRLLAWAMALVLASAALPDAAQAAGLNAFLQGYRTAPGKVIVYCGGLPEDETYTPEQFTVKLSDEDVPVASVSTVEAENEGVTYYCLVDVSGSMSDEQTQQAKEVLYILADNLGEQDNMVIGRVGTTLETTEFLTDAASLRAEIDALDGHSDYTALYGAMVESITALGSSNAANAKKCMVILSDGDDETKIGTTREEVLAAIGASGIPVYTVATLRTRYNEQQIRSAENLGAFARQSVGGRDFAPSVDDVSSESVGRAILASVRGSVVLSLDTSDVRALRDELLLSVLVETENNTYVDTLNLLSSELLDPVEETVEEADADTESAEATDEDEDEDTQETTETAETEDSGSAATGWIIGAAILLFIAAAALLMRRQKKKDAAAKASAKNKRQKLDSSEENVPLRRSVEPVPPTEPMYPGEQPRLYELTFQAVGHADIAFTLTLPENEMKTVGRNQKSDLVLNPGDRNLSSVHCRLCCTQGAVQIWDMESRNGTFVNGVPIREIGMATVQDGDFVRAGGYEYRVTIRKS